MTFWIDITLKKISPEYVTAHIDAFYRPTFTACTATPNPSECRYD